MFENAGVEGVGREAIESETCEVNEPSEKRDLGGLMLVIKMCVLMLIGGWIEFKKL